MMIKIGLALAALVLLAVGVVLYQQRFTTQVAALPKPTVSVATVAPMPTAPVTLPKADLKVTVELSEQKVNQLLRDGLSRHGYQVDDLVVRLEGGEFVATATQQVAFFRLPLQVVGKVGVVDGQISVQPTTVSAAGAQVPQDAIDLLAGVIRSELAAAVNDLPLRLTGLQIQHGKLVVEGVSK